jgi:hypothetical protein
MINEQPYKSVNAVLELIKILYEYIKVIRFFRDVSYEASCRLLDLLKSFNATTLGLILGSEAFQKKILEKGINCRHLSITS